MYNKIRSVRSSLLPASSNNIPILKNIHRDLGTIEHSFRMALDPNKVDKVARTKAGLISLFLDLTAPLLVFFLSFIGEVKNPKNKKLKKEKQTFPNKDKSIDKKTKDSSFEDELEKLAKRGLKE